MIDAQHPQRIPVSTAARIGTMLGCDQVIIFGRIVGTPGLEWVTTWGKDEVHCNAAALIGAALKDDVTPTLERQARKIAALEWAVDELTNVVKIYGPDLQSHPGAEVHEILARSEQAKQL